MISRDYPAPPFVLTICIDRKDCSALDRMASSHIEDAKIGGERGSDGTGISLGADVIATCNPARARSVSQEGCEV